MNTFSFTLILLLLATTVLAQTAAECEQCILTYNSCIFSSTNPYEISQCATDQINCYAAHCGTSSNGGVGCFPTEKALSQDCNLSVSRAIRNQDNILDYTEFKDHIEVWAKMRCRNDLDAPDAKPLTSIFSEDDLQDIYTKMSCAVCTGFFDTSKSVLDGSSKSCGCDGVSPEISTINPLNFYTSTTTEVTEYCKITWGVASNYCLQHKPNYSSGTSGSKQTSGSAGRTTTVTTTMVVWILMTLTGVHHFL
mmetsp:Transcript_18390/g.27784  ORF Transcript_18390/g.27784 Transcript_18390/m.27784 type:complete len:251 (+) Transcript_18390:143-895(+)